VEVEVETLLKQPVLRFKEEIVPFYSSNIKISDMSLLNGQCSYETFLKAKYYRPSNFKGTLSPLSPGYSAMAEGSWYHKAYKDSIGLRPGEDFDYKLEGNYKGFNLSGVIDLIKFGSTTRLEEWKWNSYGNLDETTTRQTLTYCYLLNRNYSLIEYRIRVWIKEPDFLLRPSKNPVQLLIKLYSEKSENYIIKELDNLIKIFSGETEVKVRVNGGCNYCDFGPKRVKTERCEYYAN